jgi:hypothetical protein
MKKRGRPELFNDEQRAEFLALIGGTRSRRAAAAALGNAPSTVSKRLKWDVDFSEAVRAAEQIPETDLLTMMRKHCEKSWLATRWLLELKYPERYCKRKGHAEFGPSADDVYDAVIGVLNEEIADEKLLKRIEARLDHLAGHDFFNTGESPQPTEEAEEEAEEAQAADEASLDKVDPPPPQPQHAAAQLPEPPHHEPPSEPPTIVGNDLFNTPGETQIKARPHDRLRTPPPPAVLAARQRSRQLAEEKRRLRKQRNHERTRLLKQRRHVKQLKKSRSRACSG